MTAEQIGSQAIYRWEGWAKVHALLENQQHMALQACNNIQ
jgi:hypothetical protein